MEALRYQVWKKVDNFDFMIVQTWIKTDAYELLELLRKIDGDGDYRITER